ncbi:spore germination protein GerW family protein [Hymenobacter sediminis]|uniref:spore germination protein GerW family protein n=1 Tax=Hymenobacter sediminis TaxID=2218621 RepID=UPI00192E54E4|nr:spore germination protein GerW family protein [Hymenobacter sediminis]
MPTAQESLQSFTNEFMRNAGVRTVFGEPIVLPYATVVPVARVVYGLGGGFGVGKRPAKAGEGEGEAAGSGGGFGGGALAFPAGVLDIRPKRTRFVSASRTRHVLLGVALGWVLARALGKGPKRGADKPDPGHKKG